MRLKDVQKFRPLKWQRSNFACKRRPLNQEDLCLVTFRADRTQGTSVAIIMRGTKNNFKAVIVVQMPRELGCSGSA